MEPRRRDTRLRTLDPPPRAGAGRAGASATGRALVIEPGLRRPAAHAAASERTPAARLDEAVGLARAIDLDVAQSGIAMLNGMRPATYLGKGKVEEFAGIIKTLDVGIVVMDSALSPVQQRNLERAWNATRKAGWCAPGPTLSASAAASAFSAAPARRNWKPTGG